MEAHACSAARRQGVAYRRWEAACVCGGRRGGPRLARRDRPAAQGGPPGLTPAGGRAGVTPGAAGSACGPGPGAQVAHPSTGVNPSTTSKGRSTGPACAAHAAALRWLPAAMWPPPAAAAPAPTAPPHPLFSSVTPPAPNLWPDTLPCPCATPGPPSAGPPSAAPRIAAHHTATPRTLNCPRPRAGSSWAAGTCLGSWRRTGPCARCGEHEQGSSAEGIEGGRGQGGAGGGGGAEERPGGNAAALCLGFWSQV